MTIHVLTAGGSIDKYYSIQASDFVVGPPAIEQALQDANVQTPCLVEPVFEKDSLEITQADRDLLRSKVAESSSPRIIVTHGTDTMIDTAKSVQGIADKTIVLTGAMQPAAFKVTDAIFNIGFAFAAVQFLPPGVYIAMNGSILDPQHAKKNSAKRCFEVKD